MVSSGRSSAANKKKAAGNSLLEDRFEFIPYHSHYNPHTLITKNGELMQVIKVEGNFRGGSCENLDGIHASLCATIRQVIIQNNVTEKISFWLHTVRKRNPMISAFPEDSATNSKIPEEFADYVNAQWKKEHEWNDLFRNDIYITILYEGQAIQLFDLKNLKSFAFPKANSRFCNKYLDKSYEFLDGFVSSVLEGIKTQCNARKLSLAERAMPTAGKVARQPVFYSEIMEFLGKILNLRSESFPLPDLDLSVALQTSILTFGFNAIESRNKEIGDRRFAAMLSVKQYIDMPVDAVDCVLQAPIELVISQSFSFVPSDKALKHAKEQKALFGMSGDIKANDSFGINQALSYDRGKRVDFGEHQTSIMIMVSDLKKLDGEVGKFLDSFAKLGLITVREEIFMEECFWAQLPGNFEFLRRRAVLPTELVAGFCRFNRYHTGNASGNHWGNYLSILPTSVNSPYFFNFHVQDNGHTVFFDFNSFEDRTGKILEYFLLAQTRKFGARMFVFDRNHSARLLLNKLGGKYFTMNQLEKVNTDLAMDRSPRLALNPFSLEASPYNISFLAAWCSLLISPDVTIDERAREILRGAVEQVYAMPPSERNLPNMVALVTQKDAVLAESLERWVGQGVYAKLFDFAQDSLDMGVDMIGFDMTSSLAKPAYMLPLFSYLMHRVIDTIDNKPTIIVINEAWDLLENGFFAPRLESLLEMLRQKNVMVIFTTSQISNCSDTLTLATVLSQTATQIYIPDEMPVPYQSKGLSLNEKDAFMLSGMSRQKGDFLLKQNGESIVLNVFFKEAEDVLAIFANDVKALISARGRFAGLPKDY